MRTTLAFASLFAVSGAQAQQATLVYRLGKDTVAVEQFTRTGNRLTGETVARSGGAINWIQYDITAGPDGRLTSATLRRRAQDGRPLPNAAVETRLRFTPDSVHREIQWPDSVQKRSFGARNAQVAPPVYSYAITEMVLAARRAGPIDSFPAFGFAGNATWTGLETIVGDTLRIRGGAYPMLVRFDRDGRLLSVDGSLTTNKIVATRENRGGLNMTSIAAAMKPTGVLSPRANATQAFGVSTIFIDYSRPQVRGRTVWGGMLVPYDSVWRTGANTATHLATSIPIAFGSVLLQPGLYTLWIQHTRNGTSLIINRAVGQWGTNYDPAQDVGRVPMTMGPTTDFVEDFTITIRTMPQNRGAIDFAWGPSVATATFDIRR